MEETCGICGVSFHYSFQLLNLSTLCVLHLIVYCLLHVVRTNTQMTANRHVNAVAFIRLKPIKYARHNVVPDVLKVP